MKKNIIQVEKKAYSLPQIEMIKLDNEISLALSSPASLPDDFGDNLMQPDGNPFKGNLV
ncbi:MAG: hypothetical protein H6Q20_2162 [Bacteroidetes bacterium]|nr:hypothetical protein [Bacteroidota bacterium]